MTPLLVPGLAFGQVLSSWLSCPTTTEANAVPQTLPGLLYWLKADAGVSSANGIISAWVNQSNAEGATTIISSGHEPTTNGITAGGLPTVRMTGQQGVAFAGGLPSGPLTIYLVFATQANTNIRKRVLAGSTNWLMGAWGDEYNFHSNGFIGSGVYQTPGRVVCETVVIDGSGASFYLNNVLQGTNPASGAPGAEASLGYPSQGNETADSDVCEVGIYQAVHTEAQRNAMYAYLSGPTRWSII